MLTALHKRLASSKGFTLVELLIVIAIIGVLAVALLAAINPVEQLRKSRDAGKLADARELLNAYERFFTSFGYYPWDTDAANQLPRTTPVTPDFTATPGDQPLITQNEIKSGFQNRNTLGLLWVSESATNEQVSICFEPESDAARQNGSMGAMQNVTNTAATAPTCPAAYEGGDDGATCYVCVPR